MSNEMRQCYIIDLAEAFVRGGQAPEDAIRIATLAVDAHIEDQARQAEYMEAIYRG